ncbi:MAG: hypothetical protein FJ096_22775 [Deltaproteobacteria bacterium]|nr:hypothetical protein [Deltaproteobacteria bacterium]
MVMPPETDATADDEDPSESWVRPGFARAYPESDELDALLRALDRGDFLTVREQAPALAARTSDEAIRAAALDLRRRLDPSPTALALIALGVALLAFLLQHHLRHAP